MKKMIVSVINPKKMILFNSKLSHRLNQIQTQVPILLKMNNMSNNKKED